MLTSTHLRKDEFYWLVTGEETCAPIRPRPISPRSGQSAIREGGLYGRTERHQTPEGDLELTIFEPEGDRAPGEEEDVEEMGWDTFLEITANLDEGVKSALKQHVLEDKTLSRISQAEKRSRRQGGPQQAKEAGG